jgi:capsular polysaccharide biosynthesis protein
LSDSTPRQKLFLEVRRRGWLVALTVLVCLLTAWVAGKAIGTSSSAEAVLVVKAKGPITDQPNASTKLATTYATLIPLDPRVERAVEAAVPGGEEWSLKTTNDPNTALIHLIFDAEDPNTAVTGAKSASRSVAGAAPVTANIAPGTISIAKLPTSADESSLTTQLLVMAVLLGALLGLVLVAFWRAGDARIDTLDELRRLLTCRCFEVRFRAKAGFPPLFDALGDRDGPRIALIPVREQDQQGVRPLATTLRNAFGKENVSSGAVPGSAGAGELDAADADTTLLVLTPGVREVELRDALDALGRYRALPAYAILVDDTPVGDDAAMQSPRRTDDLTPSAG